MSNVYDVIIIGAGAAGLMCAIEAGLRGKQVLVLDSANKAGKKILMSGGGRCNFTNYHVEPACYQSHNPHFAKSALSRYTPWDFIRLVEKHQIPYYEKTLGQLFCVQKSQDILNMLLQECELARVTIKLKTKIENIEQKDLFMLTTSLGLLRTKALVIATGGLSIPTLGSSPFAYQVAERFGISVYPTRAGLVPLTLNPSDKETFAPLSGIAVMCSARTPDIVFNEALLFTHRGLSGPAILQISSYWTPGNHIEINLLPDMNLLTHLKETRLRSPKKQIAPILYQLLPKRVVDIFLPNTYLNKPLADFANLALEALAETFHHWRIKPNGTEGYRTAEVTLGGIDCDEISSKTMESKRIPGLYFIGEALDVTGWLGGYNFQWAWSSGYVAGNAV